MNREYVTIVLPFPLVASAGAPSDVGSVETGNVSSNAPLAEILAPARSAFTSPCESGRVRHTVTKLLPSCTTLGHGPEESME